LHRNKPSESHEVGDDNVWPHEFKHILFALEVVHKDRDKEEHKPSVGQQIELFRDIIRILILNRPSLLLLGVTLVLLYHNEVSKESRSYEQERVVDRRDFVGDIRVYSPDEINLQSFDLRVKNSGFCVVRIIFTHF
tara:strand:+ start:111 stop:518 length:408 start_codon:yes stop_codon:yes gene_type:complete